jgi:predicted transcriptional regulator
MDTTPPLPGDNAPAARFESVAEKHRRLADEAEMLAEARAEIAAGLAIDAAEVEAWIDSIGTERELPPPYTRR